MQLLCKLMALLGCQLSVPAVLWTRDISMASLMASSYSSLRTFHQFEPFSVSLLLQRSIHFDSGLTMVGCTTIYMLVFLMRWSSWKVGSKTS